MFVRRVDRHVEGLGRNVLEESDSLCDFEWLIQSGNRNRSRTKEGRGQVLPDAVSYVQQLGGGVNRLR